MNVVNARSGSARALIDLNCSVLDGDVAIKSLQSLDFNFANFLVCGSFNIGCFEGEAARAVVINDSDTAASVITLKSVALRVVHLNVEVLVGLPLIIVDNLNLQLGLLTDLFKCYFFLFMNEVRWRLCLSFHGLHDKSKWLACAALNVDKKIARTF